MRVVVDIYCDVCYVWYIVQEGGSAVVLLACRPSSVSTSIVPSPKLHMICDTPLQRLNALN